MKPANLTQLRAQWDDLMQSFGVAEGLSGTAFADLAARYGEDGRYYHTLAHIQNVLKTIQTLRPYAEDIRAIQLAAWFHDAIYDPRAADNEEQSAQYAGRILRDLQIGATVIAQVQLLIQATIHQYPCPDDIDCQILLDADLATFASDEAEQEWIEQAIRQEFAFVPEAAYREGRRRILAQFLQRERIFYTQPMAAALEERARQNIARSIARLE